MYDCAICYQPRCSCVIENASEQAEKIKAFNEYQEKLLKITKKPVSNNLKLKMLNETIKGFGDVEA